MIRESCPDFRRALFLEWMTSWFAVDVEFLESAEQFYLCFVNFDKKLLKSFSIVSMLRKAEQKETIYNGQTNT
jgi:hypothetical protein